MKLKVEFEGYAETDYDPSWNDNYVTFYFTGPTSLLDVARYPEACMATISIEVPRSHIDAEHANVSMSPTREIDNGLEDYDWSDLDLPTDEINELLEIGKSHMK